LPPGRTANKDSHAPPSPDRHRRLPASHALLDLARRYCRPGEHTLHVLLAIDATFAVHEQRTAYTEQELEEYPAACDEQQLAEHAVSNAVKTLREAGFDSLGCMVAGQPEDAIVAKAQELECELIIMGHRICRGLGDCWIRRSAPR
jgi:nucleotide-binding universal stress UspA family protein